MSASKGTLVLQRILGVVLVLLGLGGIALGVASATVWKDPDTAVATARPAGEGTLVVTDPGVLELVDDDVTITATAPGDQKVTLAIGREVDVLGWVGADPYTRVTGLSDWETLSTRAVEAQPAEGEEAPADPTPAPDPAGSDMWVQQASDTGGASLRWSDRPGRWVLLAAGVGEGAQAPTLELTWPRTVETPYLWPGVGAGAFLLLAGVVLLLTARRRKGTADRVEDADAPTGGTDRTDSGTEPAASPAWPAVVARDEATASPAGPSGDTSPGRPDERGAVTDAAVAEAGRPADAGTDPVPVIGRFARRSRRDRAASGTEPRADAETTAPATAAVPVPPADAAPAPAPVPVPEGEPSPAEPPVVTTGSLPVVDGRRLTRRELREREEAARRAQETGVGRRLRALTGSIPVVRPQPPAKPDAGAETGDGQPPAESARASRAAAWRQAWGFTPNDDTDTTDGGNR
jgi:hypothetical protein